MHSITTMPLILKWKISQITWISYHLSQRHWLFFMISHFSFCKKEASIKTIRHQQNWPQEGKRRLQRLLKTLRFTVSVLFSLLSMWKLSSIIPWLILFSKDIASLAWCENTAQGHYHWEMVCGRKTLLPLDSVTPVEFPFPGSFQIL